MPLLAASAALLLGASTPPAAAAPPDESKPARPAPQKPKHTEQAAAAKQPGWSQAYPNIAADLEAGRPLVIHVSVPLCSNAQINCGASWAGQPGRLSTNLYWGAIFGARRIFDGKRSGWERVEVTQKDDVYLERVVYRRTVSAKQWGLARCEADAKCEIEQLVVLQAIHGSKIDQAVDDLWSIATLGSQLSFVDGAKPEGERERTVSVHVAGYAGHNRLMDGKRLPAPTPPPRKAGTKAETAAQRGQLPAFVLACYSDRYFSSALEAAGSENLVSTQTLMAPEGYLIDAVAKALGDNASEAELKQRTVHTYAKWQRISLNAARRVFLAAKKRK